MMSYSLLNTIATLSIPVFHLWRIKEKQEILGERARRCLKRGKPFSVAWVYATVEIFVLSLFQYYFPGYLNRPVGDLLNTGANYFGLILSAPLFLLVACWFLKAEPLRTFDLITPAYPLALSISKIACFAADCCCGIECGFGFYATVSGQKEFPVQLLESLAALLIFVVLFLNEGKFKVGTVFPIYLILYSGTRFFTEFFRIEPAVFLGLKTYHFLCIVGVLVGVCEYMLVRKWAVNKKFE